MSELGPSDLHHLKAAEGWLELGNHIEANEEIEKVTARIRGHPDVLELRFLVYQAAKKYDACYDIGEAMIKLAPDRYRGWCHRSFALHFLGRTQEAYDLLFPAMELFPKSFEVFYDMACYSSRLGQFEKAREWLAKSFELGEAKQIKLNALEERDLEPFWAQIGES
jgi:tetratricopeptide (TPR) repeat protein